jgi:acetyl-CoA synthetase
MIQYFIFSYGYNQFLKATGIKLMEGYGQTELTITLATFPWMEPKPGSMGKPAPGYKIDIIDGTGRSCDVGEEGQIVIYTHQRKPVGMFDGYYNDPEKTKAAWHDGIYYTGDMAWRDEDGYYWFVGRTDDVIKSSGYRIGPFEVESALLEHPAVLECAITAVPDPIRGQVVKATVVLAKGYQASQDLAKQLQDYVKKTTAPYKYPRIVEFVEQLPKTISGKIRRVEIRNKDHK